MCKDLSKAHPAVIGLLQAVGVVVYCCLIGLLFWSMEIFYQAPPQIVVIPLMLVLLVFSAAVTGSLVFGYPAYLALNKQMKKALSVVGFTLLFALIAIILAFAIIFISA